MQLDEVQEWWPFKNNNGDVYDLSFLNAKKATYTHSAEGKADITYEFWITYSSHCFTKDYEHLNDADRGALNYHTPKEDRPFCMNRYGLAKEHLCEVIENLDSPKYRILDGRHGSYLTAKILADNGSEIWYHIPFKVYKESKKYRIHVMSAYPSDEDRGGGKVGFFKIAYNLRMNKKLPKNQK